MPSAIEQAERYYEAAGIPRYGFLKTRRGALFTGLAREARIDGVVSSHLHELGRHMKRIHEQVTYATREKFRERLARVVADAEEKMLDARNYNVRDIVAELVRAFSVPSLQHFLKPTPPALPRRAASPPAPSATRASRVPQSLPLLPDLEAEFFARGDRGDFRDRDSVARRELNEAYAAVKAGMFGRAPLPIQERSPVLRGLRRFLRMAPASRKYSVVHKDIAGVAPTHVVLKPQVGEGNVSVSNRVWVIGTSPNTQIAKGSGPGVIYKLLTGRRSKLSSVSLGERDVFTPSVGVPFGLAEGNALAIGNVGFVVHKVSAGKVVLRGLTAHVKGKMFTFRFTPKSSVALIGSSSSDYLRLMPKRE